MSERITIHPHETGTVRVFRIDLTPAGIAGFDAATALGAEHLDAAEAEVFDVADLAGLGLSGYLSEGMGIPEEELAPMRAHLDVITGHVLVLPSRAVAGGTGQTLAPRAPLIHVGTFHEDRPPVSFDPLPDAAARGNAGAGGPAPAPGRQRGGWGTLLLIGAALLAMALFILGVLE